jgi:hypothetical protein
MSIREKEEEIVRLRKELADLKTSDKPVDGDGKAVFIEFGNEEEYEEHVKMEDRGWRGFYNKIINLNNHDEANRE